MRSTPQPRPASPGGQCIGTFAIRVSRGDRSLGHPGPVTEIRVAQVGDAEAIARVHVAGWQRAYRGLLPDEFLDALSWEQRFPGWVDRLDPAPTGPGGTLVAGDGGAVIGFASIGPARDTDRARPGHWELYAIYLDPARWGRGDGSQLLAAASATIPSGVRDVSLWVLDGNSRARRFYERHGFAADGTRKDDVIGGAAVVEVRYLHA
jgi:GNAT superfamily N-acetyltransferase